MCLCVRMLALEWKERAFIEKVNSRCFYVDFRRPYWYTKTVHQYGVSIKSSTKVRETFRRITQKLWATKTWDLEKLFTYYSFITFHFLDFFHWTGSNLFFCAVFIAWQWKRSLTRKNRSRKTLVKQIISCNKVRIETVRYDNVSRDERLCNLSNCKKKNWRWNCSFLLQIASSAILL